MFLVKPVSAKTVISYSYTKKYEIEKTKMITSKKTTVKTKKYKRSKKSINIGTVKSIVPKNVYKKFPKSKCKIIINKKDTYFKKYKGTVAYYDADKNKIVLKEFSKRDLLHELGHWVSHHTGDFAYSSKFKKIYKSEKKKFKGHNAKYVRSSQGEFYAGCFYEYCTNPSNLKKYCPMTYNFIKKSIKSLR